MAASRAIDHHHQPSTELDHHDRSLELITTVHVNHYAEKSITREDDDDDDEIDYSRRAQWLRAAMLGANDGLVTVASLMMGVGAVKTDPKAMLLAGFAGLIAGAGSMAIGEYVSVCTQRDIEAAQMKRESTTIDDREEALRLPNPAQAAIASALAFSVGAVVPLLGSAFVTSHKVRLAVVAAVASVALVVFGGVGAVLGRTPVVKSSARVLVGGWVAMAITFGLTKFIVKATDGLHM